MLRPIKIDSSRLYDGLREAGGNKVFYTYGARSPAVGMASINPISSGESPITFDWAINIWGPPIDDTVYCVRDRYNVTKELFFDHMMNHHTEHFEWLLFHPEWLK